MGSSVAVLSDAVSASDIQIFTREGRHIAGSPLNNVEISALMNSENGFTKGALYNGAYLNQTNNAYRGMSLDVSYQGGLYAIDLGSNGSTAVAIGGNTTVPANTVRSQDFTVTMANGDRKDISMSAGISAGAAAAKLNEALSENGVLAESNLRVELSSFSAAGEVKFDIESLNAVPITIAAAITPSNIEPLARAINNETANTGVSAVLSANGKRLILESKGGEDIIFSSVGSASPEFSSKILGTDGSAVTAPLVIGSNGSNGRINTARFSGILTVSAGDAFSIDAGNGVVNAVKDPLRGGFVSVSGNATGDTKRIAFEVNPDSSGSAAALDGLKAVAASGSFSLGLPTIDSAIRFDANISASSLTDLSTTAVNKAVVEAIREQGPLSSLTGSPTSPLPAEGASVTVSFAGDLYKLTMADGDVLVSGGEPGRVTAYFDASGRLQLFGGGTIAGQQVVVVDDSVVGNNLNAASQFGIATPTSRLTGREFTLAAGLPTLSVMFNGSQVSIAIAADGTISKTPAVAGLSARWQESSSGRGRIILEVSSAVDQMQVTRPTNSLGFKTADVSLRLTDGIIQAKSLTGDVVAIEADARGIAGQTITMSNMPHEDLLILVTGGGARSIGAVYGEVLAAPERSQISVEVSDENGTVIEILDSETGHSIATRLLDQNGFANFGDYQLELRGLAKKGDKFSIGQNLNATGDGRNMNLLLNLQTADANGTNSGGFQQVFNTIVASVGAAVRSGDISLEAATAQRDAAAEAESEFSGVNLDSEAAALMEFQQAYQASARILSTARELFQSLMDVV
jgi:flagellar hook-associated protein 1 FlgK